MGLTWSYFERLEGHGMSVTEPDQDRANTDAWGLSLWSVSWQEGVHTVFMAVSGVLIAITRHSESGPLPLLSTDVCRPWCWATRWANNLCTSKLVS